MPQAEGMRQAEETPLPQMAENRAEMAKRVTLMTNGIVGKATITSVTETGETVYFNPEVEVGLRVELPDRPPYDAAVRKVIPTVAIQTFQAGIEVPVRVSPDDPQVLMIG